MDNCMGFHIKKLTTGYEVYFDGKTKNDEFKLESASNYVTYRVVKNKDYEGGSRGYGGR